MVWKLSTLGELPILNSFSSGQGYILFLFVNVWGKGGERGGTENLLTVSFCLNSYVAGSFLGFVLGEVTWLRWHLSYVEGGSHSPQLSDLGWQ